MTAPTIGITSETGDRDMVRLGTDAKGNTTYRHVSTEMLMTLMEDGRLNGHDGYFYKIDKPRAE